MATCVDSPSPIGIFALKADQELLLQVKDYAAKRWISANCYGVDAVKTRLKMDQEQEWREGFDAMGRDPDLDVGICSPPPMRSFLAANTHGRRNGFADCSIAPEGLFPPLE